LEKVGVGTWFFDGESVVECMVRCGALQHAFSVLKNAPTLRKIFVEKRIFLSRYLFVAIGG
jgi:hypothetical protein